MKTTRKTIARLFPLLALLALVPLSCTDAGDEPSGPTGPATQYNSETDYSGAGITAKASPGSVVSGNTFTALATFTDANGSPVSNAPLAIAAEAGSSSAPYFSFATNPTVTNSEGKVSILVYVSSTCPDGSYRFTVYSSSALSGATASGSFTVMVSGTGTGSVSSITLTPASNSATLPAILPSTVDVSFLASATATSDCDLQLSYQASGAGYSGATGWVELGSINPRTFTVRAESEGTLLVIARAYCTGGTTYITDDASVMVTLAATTP